MDQSAREPRRTAATDQGRRAVPRERRGAALLVLGGLLAGVAAGFLGAADQLHPSGGWIARRLAEQGVQPGLLLLAAATVLLGAALVASLAKLARRVEESSLQAEEVFEKVGGQVVVLRRSLHDFRTEVLWLHEAMTGLSEVVRDHVAQAQAARHDDASKESGLLRVAASLDQLGARLDDHLQRSELGDAQAFTRLEERLEGLGAQLGESLRELLQECSTGGPAVPLEAPPVGAGEPEPAGGPYAAIGEEPRPEEEVGYELEAAPGEEGRDSDYGGIFDEPYVPSDQDLHIEVTFEEGRAEGLDADAELGAELPDADIDPALFETSLGLLDAFDDDGDYQPEAEVPPPLPGQARPDPGADAAGPAPVEPPARGAQPGHGPGSLSPRPPTA